MSPRSSMTLTENERIFIARPDDLMRERVVELHCLSIPFVDRVPACAITGITR